MAEGVLYEVVEGGTGWVLWRAGSTPLVEFPTRVQAIRAAVAVCLDEGMTRLIVRGADGVVEEIDASWPAEALDCQGAVRAVSGEAIRRGRTVGAVRRTSRKM
jgi:hypothetical protein